MFFLGMVVQAGAGQIPSRQATMKAGLPPGCPPIRSTRSVLPACGRSSLGIRSSAAARREIVAAGGMENMSAVPYLLPRVRMGCAWETARSSTG